MQYKYTAVLEPMENNEGYYAYVPDLRGVRYIWLKSPRCH